MKGINRYKITEWFRICPKCGNRVYHKNQNSLNVGIYFNKSCWECKTKEHSQKLKGRKRQPFSNKWKRNLAIGHKKSVIWKQSMNTPEYKEKHRQKMIRMIKENKMNVAYNPNACDVFDYFNQKLNWNGIHAKNGKEKMIDVFYLDYYEPNLNLVIEWDEKHHKKAKRRQYDGFRQKTITDTIGCEFYRMDDTAKSVKKVDKSPTDRSIELQNVLDEYYEIKQ
jgi:hypothetical protein